MIVPRNGIGKTKQIGLTLWYYWQYWEERVILNTLCLNQSTWELSMYRGLWRTSCQNLGQRIEPIRTDWYS